MCGTINAISDGVNHNIISPTTSIASMGSVNTEGTGWGQTGEDPLKNNWFLADAAVLAGAGGAAALGGAEGAAGAGAAGAGAAGAGAAGASSYALPAAIAGSAGLNYITGQNTQNAIDDAASQQATATQTAAELQAQGQADALAFNKEQWDKIQADQAPWLAAGTQALGDYQKLPAFAAPEKFTGNRMTNYVGPQDMAAPPQTGAYTGGTAIAPAPVSGKVGPAQEFGTYTGQEQFDPSAVGSDSGFQFRTDQAQKALERSQVGRRLGGRAAQEVTQLSQDMASQEYGAAYNRGVTTNQLVNQNRLTPYLTNRDTSNQNLQNRLAATGFNNQAGTQDLQSTMAVAGYNDQTGMAKYLTNRDTSNQNLQNAVAVNQLNAANNLNTFNANQAVDTTNYGRAVGEYQMGYNQTWDQYTNQQNKLAQLAGLGYNATQNTAQTGAQIAANQGNIAMTGANAIAGTQMAGANAQGQAAIAGAANNAQTWSNVGNNALMAYLLK